MAPRDVVTEVAPGATAETALRLEFNASAARAASVETRDAGITPTPIDFATYDGSREVVHPDVVAFPEAWQGHRYWAALTPYPNSAARFENPSLYGSADGNAWAVPAGVTNPLATTKRGYLSDPDMVWNPAQRRLQLYYREVVNLDGKSESTRHSADRLWMTTSSDGARWSAPQRLVTDSKRYMVSPTVVRRDDGGWRMWEVDAGASGCDVKASRLVMRTSADGAAWSAAAPVAFSQPGFNPWHVDVQWVPARREYWALVAAYATGQGCTATSLFLATSPDGASWTTYPTPVLARGTVPQFEQNVYRSSFAVEADGQVHLWFTGARVTRPAAGKKQPAVLAWTAAVAHTTADVLLARVQQTGTAAAARAASRSAAVVVRTEDMP